MKKLLLVVLLAFACQAQAEFQNPDPATYEDASNLKTLREEIVLMRQEVRQIGLWIVGLILVRLTAHGWRV